MIMDESLFSSTTTTSSILKASIETFDGSTITDPIIVSNIFWKSLQTKILSVIIGQILATIVFGIMTLVISTQLSNIGNYVAKNVFKDDDYDNERDSGGDEDRGDIMNDVGRLSNTVKMKV